jgi:pimeloyl-ACP methyl ester carboxylesterase
MNDVRVTKDFLVIAFGDRVGQIDISKFPLYLLTGEYDYSCTAKGTLAVAEKTGAPATILQGLGHFPKSEDPEKFISYLFPVLEKIKAL